MQLAGLVLKKEPYTLSVPRSQRGGEVVEPMVSTQWFVRIQPLAEAALEAVRDGRIRIVPDRFTKVYYNWLENIQDWVHLAPALVGQPHPGVVLRRVWPDDRGSPGSGEMSSLRQRRRPTGSRCAGHLVLLRAVALLHAGLAG